MNPHPYAAPPFHSTFTPPLDRRRRHGRAQKSAQERAQVGICQIAKPVRSRCWYGLARVRVRVRVGVRVGDRVR